MTETYDSTQTSSRNKLGRHPTVGLLFKEIKCRRGEAIRSKTIGRLITYLECKCKMSKRIILQDLNPLLSSTDLFLDKFDIETVIQFKDNFKGLSRSDKSTKKQNTYPIKKLTKFFNDNLVLYEIYLCFLNDLFQIGNIQTLNTIFDIKLATENYEKVKDVLKYDIENYKKDQNVVNIENEEVKNVPIYVRGVGLNKFLDESKPVDYECQQSDELATVDQQTEYPATVEEQKCHAITTVQGDDEIAMEVEPENVVWMEVESDDNSWMDCIDVTETSSMSPICHPNTKQLS